MRPGTVRIFLDGLCIEREVRICEPGARHGFVAADHHVQRAEEPDEQDRKLERFRVGVQNVIALLHPGDRRLAHAQNGGERGLLYVEFVCGE
jgi:hypothetical protein